MSKKVRVLLVLTILVVALAVSSTILGNFASSSENIAVGAGFQGANQTGMAIYQQSERAGYRRIPVRIMEEGMAIYRASERNLASHEPTVSKEAGLAIYHESERNVSLVRPVGTTEEGLAIYRASERSIDLPAVRLYNGKPFNAYQRSEWLGAER